MLNMKMFHQLLCASEKQDSYLEALRALTKVSPVRLKAMSSGLDWQMW